MQYIKTVEIDDLGRFTLPVEIREMLDWADEARIEIFYVDGGTAMLQLEKEVKSHACGLCRKREKQLTVAGMNICSVCAQYIAKLTALKQPFHYHEV